MTATASAASQIGRLLTEMADDKVRVAKRSAALAEAGVMQQIQDNLLGSADSGAGLRIDIRA